MINLLTDKTKQLFSYKIVRYVLVGGTATLLHIFVASLYIYFIHDSVWRSNIIGFLIAYVFSYLLQSRLVFQHAVSVQKAIKYFTVQFGALLLAILSSEIFDSYNSYLHTLIVAVLLPFITFVIHKFWTFKEKKEIHESCYKF